ncbi:MAG TPA: hypothetical protein DEP72_03755 [Clostridiales bacterium]|nr:MAG: hypothetical protein A2Y18_05315 [Clostridiales bacterium GWD2_32_19]HCC07269.1 hypothetical protein [Clostridiales bacterium]
MKEKLRILNKTNVKIGLALVVIFTVSCIIYIYNKDSFMVNIEDGNYIKANKYYTENILGNKKRENVAIIEIDEFLEIQKDLFNQGKLTKDEVMENTSVIGDLLIVDKYKEKFEKTGLKFSNDISEIETSKLKYIEGMNFYEENNLIKALNIFNHISEKDSNYESATNLKEQICKKVEEEVLNEIDTLKENKKYYELYDKLDALSTVSENVEIKNELNAIKEIIKENAHIGLIKIGMTRDEVNNYYIGDFVEGDEKGSMYITNKQDFNNCYDAYTMFRYEMDKLNEICILYNIKNSNNNVYIGNYEVVKENLTKSLGSPVRKSDYKWLAEKNPYMEDGLAVACGDLILQNQWIKNNAEYELTLLGNNFDINFMLSIKEK